MSIQERWDTVATITGEPKTTSDGFGGVKKGTPSAITSSYKCQYWVPNPFARQQIVQQQGLDDNANIIQFTGEINASVVEKYFFAPGDGTKFRIVSLQEIKGRHAQVHHYAGVAVKVSA